MCRLASLFLLLFAIVLPAQAKEPRWIGPLVESAQSKTFAPIVLAGTRENAALKAAGYVQEEWLIEGAANIYHENADGSLQVRSADVPYVTQLVIVRPRDPRKFNGIVQMGFAHPQFANGNWGRIDTLVLRSGMAYAKLVIGGDPGTRQRSTTQWPVATPLLYKWYDPSRYAAFSWPQDDGVRWDVIGQAASFLRSGSHGGPLAGLKVRGLYVSGWSFLGSLQRSFINFGFHDRYRRTDGGPVIDGYLIGISAGAVAAGNVPLNSVDPVKERGRDMLRVIDSPVIELTSEMEAITNIYPMRAESDGVRGGHRIYELGGVSHSDSGVEGQATPARAQLAARGHPGIEREVTCSMAFSDVPMRDVAQAALVNLDTWVRGGKAPPRASRLQVAEGTKNYNRDGFGNPIGGIRAAQLDVPLVRYGVPDLAECGGKSPGRKLNRLPLDRATLMARYPGGSRHYLAQFDARADALVRQRWLLPADAAVQKMEARAFARLAFKVVK
ncbi:alpha/beta hydrolase domain-containing protein [Novosphingobium aquae]|uniref:Alpha/beta hydrolase domain-containing protein n=1 Tax=Novosphingobium aquae TaxID=3133435 RepID=A0ABU8S4U4_9SPHN